MATLISVILFLSLTIVITYYGHRVYARPGRVHERLGEPLVVATMQGVVTPAQQQPGGLVRIVRQIGEKVPLSPADASAARRQLIAAGFRSEAAVAALHGYKVLACGLALILALLLRDYIPFAGVPRLVLIALAGFVGWMVPGFVLEYLVARRQETLRLSLPDALDLMVVCVEAGLGLDQAFVNVSRDLQITHPEICEEFSLVTLEIRAGKRRADALHNLAERTGETELQKLVAILIQSDRFGTSIAESLRTHADFMRIRRRQEAEERAGKVGVKLVFPIFFFILPSMLVVTAGPGLLQIMKYLFPMMRQFTLDSVK